MYASRLCVVIAKTPAKRAAAAASSKRCLSLFNPGDTFREHRPQTPVSYTPISIYLST